MTRSIEIIVAPAGEVRIDAVNFKGADCEQATRFLEEARWAPPAPASASRNTTSVSTPASSRSWAGKPQCHREPCCEPAGLPLVATGRKSPAGNQVNSDGKPNDRDLGMIRH